jgi:hypothetical protein
MGSSAAPSGNETPLYYVTQYNRIPPAAVWQGTEAAAQSLIPTAGTLGRLRVVLDAPPGTGKGWKVSVRLNGGPTAVTCTVADTATKCQDVAHAVALAPGDRVAYESVPSVSPAWPTRMRLSVQFTPASADQFILPSGGGAGNATTWFKPLGEVVGDETWTNIAIPAAGVVKSLFVWCDTPVAAGASRAFTVRTSPSVSGTIVDSLVTCTMGAAATTCADTVHPLAVAVGDVIDVRHTMTGTPGSANCAVGMVFDPTTTGVYILTASTGGGSVTDASATRYGAVNASDGSMISATEPPLLLQAAQATRIVGMAVALNGSPPGGGNSIAFTLRQNGSNTALTCTANATVSCNATGNVTIADDDLLSTIMVPAGPSPGYHDPHVSYAATQQ